MRESAPYNLHDLGSTPLLTRREERALLARAKDGDFAAREHLILANLRLIIAIARPYTSHSYPMEDAIGDGVLGLDRAITKFDLSTTYRFSTYAYWWIRQGIQKAALVTSRHLKTPSQAIAQMHKLMLSYATLHAELGREPTVEELSAKSGLAEERVIDLLDICVEPVSLDAPCHEGGDTLGDLQTAPRAAHAAHSARLREFVESMLLSLPEALSRVLELRFGLDGHGRRTYREVTLETGWSRETIKRREREAIRALQSAFGETDHERETTDDD